jgi:hypothetical protein
VRSVGDVFWCLVALGWGYWCYTDFLKDEQCVGFVTVRRDDNSPFPFWFAVTLNVIFISMIFIANVRALILGD